MLLAPSTTACARRSASAARGRLGWGGSVAKCPVGRPPHAALQEAPPAPLSDEQLAGLCASCDLPSLVRLGGAPAVLRYLGVDPIIGQDSAGVASSRERFGPNTTPSVPPPDFLTFVVDALEDTTLRILIGAAALSLAASAASPEPGGWHDGAAILATVAVCVLLGAANNYKQALQFAGLSADKRDISVSVLRAGRRDAVSVYDLVVGDIVVLAQGDAVPADGLLLSSAALKVDDSSMTGESEATPKSAGASPFMLGGCKIAEGCGEMVVTAVGMQTEWGRVMAVTGDSNEEETPLQQRLEGVATTIGKGGTAVAALVTSAVLTHSLVDAAASVPPSAGGAAALAAVGAAAAPALLNALIVGVAIVVVAVPEGLPLAVTLSLAYSLRAMAADKALVRHLSACETMGGATAVCTDKTGTLTTNCMTVVRSTLGGGGECGRGGAGVPAHARPLLAQALFANTTGSVSPDGAQTSGSATEKALLGFAVSLDGAPSFAVSRKAAPLLRMQPFDSARKTMGVAVKLPHSGGGGGGHGGGAAAERVFWKGAPDAVLASCTHELASPSSPAAQAPSPLHAPPLTKPLTDERRAELRRVLDGYSADALRTIALAYADLPPGGSGSDDEALAPGGGGGDGAGSSPAPPLPCERLVLLALFGIADPVRPGAAAAVAACRSAGITVRMVTGDNAATAAAIAREVGILDGASSGGASPSSLPPLSSAQVVLEGPEFRAMTDEGRAEVAPRLAVLARATPTDKLVLVKLLRAAGDVVAVTGDGTNDAPALREADVGLSMGIAGTEVAKEASDIVLLDDDFASAVRVVRWGRAVRRNVQAFLQFQLTVNVVALILNTASALAGVPLPLTPVQLLWVNLIMDSLGALALATEPPTETLMRDAPAGRTAPIISNPMFRNIGAMAAWQLAVLCGLYFGGSAALGLDSGSDADALTLRTVVFNSFVFMQVFNEINARSIEGADVFSGLGRNPTFVAIVAGTAATQALLVRFGGDFAATTPLDGHQWGVSLVAGASVLPIALLVKQLRVPASPPLPQLLLPWLFKPEAAPPGGPSA